MILQLFLVGLLAGLLGSLQPGPVNSTVVLASAVQGTCYAKKIAFGGSLVQGLGALLVWYYFKYLDLSFLMRHANVLGYFFLLLTLYYFIKKDAPRQVAGTAVGDGVIRGSVLAAFNPQIIPYWAFVSGSVALVVEAEHSFLMALSLGLGAIVGTYAILNVLIIVSRRFKGGLAKLPVSNVLAIVSLMLAIRFLL